MGITLKTLLGYVDELFDRNISYYFTCSGTSKEDVDEVKVIIAKLKDKLSQIDKRK